MEVSYFETSGQMGKIVQNSAETAFTIPFRLYLPPEMKPTYLKHGKQ